MAKQVPGQDPGVDSLIEQLRGVVAARTAEVASLRAQAEAEAARLEQELVFARRIQLNLMPPVGPQPAGWRIATAYRAARMVGGDFYDTYELPARAGSMGLVVADVTGKGITAALMMAFTRAVLRAAAYNGSGPADAIKRTNRVLTHDARTGLFVTAFVGELDAASGEPPVRGGRPRGAAAGPSRLPGNGRASRRRATCWACSTR